LGVDSASTGQKVGNDDRPTRNVIVVKATRSGAAELAGSGIYGYYGKRILSLNGKRQAKKKGNDGQSHGKMLTAAKKQL